MEMLYPSEETPMNFPEVDQETFERVWRRVMPDQPLNNGQGAAPPQMPMTQGQTPMTQGQMPMMQGQTPMMQGQSPMTQGQMPMMQGQMPMTQGQIPMTQGQIPMTQGQMPMMQGQMPMTQGQMPMMQGQMPMMQGQTSEAHSDTMMPWGGSPAWQEWLDLPRSSQTAPVPDVLSCFEGNAAGLVPLLETLLDNAAAAERDCLTLSRRAVGQTSRMLTRHAARHRRQLRRLSAAHFLVTGTRYQPRREALWNPTVSLPLALRELFMRERSRAAALRHGVEGSGDPCLRALFAELSGENETLADDIRLLLEDF